MNSRLVISLLCAAAVVLACGSLTQSDASVAHAAKSPPTRLSSKRTTTDVTQKVQGVFAIAVEPHALRFAFDVKNSGAKEVEVAFPNGKEYDFAILDSVGREVYRWGKARMFTQSLRNESIDAGDTMRIEERAATTLPRGSYVAVATLHSSNFPMQQRVDFELR